MSEDIKAVLREYVAGSPILRRPGPLSDSTPLAAYGILDSMAVLELVLFLESRFDIEFSTRDLDRRRLETIEHIESLVREKIAQKKARQGGLGQ
jgi:acyl carrier protein